MAGKSLSAVLILALGSGAAAHQQPDSVGVYFVGPEVTAPTITRAAPAEGPEFPRGFSGGFSVWAVTMQPDGTPTDLHLIQSLGAAFDAAAARAIYASGYVAGRQNGQPVPVHIGIAVPFFRGVHPEPRIAVLERDLDGVEAAAGRARDAPAVLIHTAEACYFSDDIPARYDATIRVSAVIGTDGIPAQVRVAKPFGLGLDQYAIQAVQRYRYLPALKDGAPAAQKITVEVRCRIYWDPREGDKFK